MNFLLAFLLIGLGSRFQIVAIFTGMLWIEILKITGIVINTALISLLLCTLYKIINDATVQFNLQVRVISTGKITISKIRNKE